MFTLETPFEQKMKFLDNEESSEHLKLKKRLKKTLYYGKMKNMDCPSLAMTELAVEYLQELVPRELGRIDMYWASSLSSSVSVTPCALMLALMYVKRLKDNNNSQYLSQASSSDLFLISVLVASKYLYDVGEDEDVSNTRWALLTKLDIEDINENERSFLAAINWKIFVKPDDFWNFLDVIEKKLAWRMSRRRDNFTYTDLNVIVSNSPLCQVLFGALTEVCKVIAVCSITYLACVTAVFVSSVTPAVVLSRVLLPLSPCFTVAPCVVSNASPSEFGLKSYGCLVRTKCVQGRAVSSVTRGDDVAKISSYHLHLSQICEPWSSNWYPKMCVHTSACVTVAFVRELMMSVFAVISQTISALSLGVSCCLRGNLFTSQTARHSLPDGFTHCHHHGHCSHNLINSSHLPNVSATCPSSNCTTVLGPRDNCKQPSETQEPKGVLACANKSGAVHEKPSCSGADDYSCWNLPNDGSSPSQNYSMMFSSIPSSPQYAEVFG